MACVTGVFWEEEGAKTPSPAPVEEAEKTAEKKPTRKKAASKNN